MEPPSGLR